MSRSMRNHFDLGGRTALVTGSSRGIGRAIALGLAEYGANVAFHCATRLAEAEEAAATARGHGVRAHATAADLADPAAPARLVDEVQERLGPIDILVLNASIEERTPWAEIGHAAFTRQIEVNLRSTMQLCQLTVPAMAERGWGRVVTLGSIQQVKPSPVMWIYAGSKMAQLNMARNLSLQVAGRGVTVNNLAPGAILTERNAEPLADPEFRARIESRIPVGRLGTPDDLVGAALLLCSDAGRYISGADLFVDGGWHAA
jgi:NAD(P)-dependent dehydrogenase (short-subunit alcohol dehydrogenase family)